MVEILEGAELTLKARLPGTVARRGKEREREREREVRSRGAADVILVGEEEHGGAILGEEERTDCVAIVAPQLPNSTVSLFEFFVFGERKNRKIPRVWYETLLWIGGSDSQ